jgi:glutamine amidotransferase/cyclase
VFSVTSVDAALAAGIFHRKEVSISEVKDHLRTMNIPVRIDIA